MARELRHIVQQLRQIVERHSIDGLTDEQLLERFVANRDEAAFEVLVWRHGAMVLNVCRRILRQEQNIEDAFQATFLTLARKAGSVRGGASLPGFLYRVASRIALRLRADTAKRARRERCQAHPPETARSEEPADALARRELRAVLDEELLHLPRKYRDPLILCDLQGQSHIQVARQLGLALGSMSRYLARGRQLLQRRLRRRGIGLSVATVAMALVEEATAAIPGEMLVRPTVTAAALFACSGSAATGVACQQAILLAEGMLKQMIVTKLKVAALVLLMGLSVAGMGWSVHRGLSAEQPESKATAEQPAAKPKTPDTEELRVDRRGDPLPAGALLRLGSVRLRHGDKVNRVVFSPDGKALASAGSDGSVRLWDVKTGAELRRLEGHWGAVYTVAFSPDGKVVASADQLGDIHLHSTATGKNVQTLMYEHNETLPILSLAFSPNGQTLASGGGDEIVRLWNTATGEELRHWFAGSIESIDRKIKVRSGPHSGGTPPPFPGVTCLRFSADGKVLATGALDGFISFWETATGKRLHRLEGPPHGFCAVAFAPDGKTVAVSGNPFIRLVDIESGRELHRLEDPINYTLSLVFSPDSKTLAGAGDSRNFRIWETASGKLLHHLEGHCGAIRSVAFSPDGKLLASGGDDHTIHLWDVARGKECLPFGGHGGLVRAASFSPDGKLVATAGHDFTVRLWDAATGVELRAFRRLNGNANAVVFSLDGKRLLTASTDSVDNTIRVWDVATGKELRQLRSQHGTISALGRTRDGRLLAGGGEGGILRLWDLEAGTELSCPQAVPGQFSKVVFSPDGKHLAAAWGVEAIYLWDTTTGQFLRLACKNYGWPICLAFSPNGRVLVTGHTNGLIRLWHIVTGQPIRELKGHRTGVSALAFAPDGKMLVSASNSGELRLWEVATGRPRYRSSGHRAEIWDLSFSPDGRLLVSASSDTTALVWDMTGRHFIAPPEQLSPEQQGMLWKDLTGEDAVLAYRAAAAFCATPKQSVPFLAKRLREKPDDHSQRIAQWIRDLDDDSFEVREKASRALADLSDLAEPALRHALKNNPSPELRRRVRALLEQLPNQPPSTQNLRALRVTEVLEQMNTAEARGLLETLAQGAPEEFVTAEAKASLARLARHH